MALTKVYRTKQSYLSMLVTVHKSPVRITFSGGDMTSGGVFTTPDQAVQKAIEQSPRFMSGEIIQIAVYGKPESVEEKTADKPVDSSAVDNNHKQETKIYPIELNTVQKAGRALMRDFGVVARDVETKSKLILKAQELNVSFPGLS